MATTRTVASVQKDLSLPAIFRTFRRAVIAWYNDNALRMGASLAYYSLFAIAPVLIVVIAVAGTLFGAEAVRGELVGQIEGLVGVEGGKAVQTLLQGTVLRGNTILATSIGVVTFVMAACGAFLELQASFNTIWRVKPAPEGQIKEFFLDRLRSFGLVVAIGFLLMVSLAASAALSAISTWLGHWAPGVPMLLQIVNIVISVLGTAALFMMLFKYLPDVKLAWQDVAVGAAITAVLFTVGKHLIGLYLGQSSTASSYGAVGSVLVLLLWVYYTSQILLIGAEFTRLYSQRLSGPAEPLPFAEKTSAPKTTGTALPV